MKDYIKNIILKLIDMNSDNIDNKLNSLLGDESIDINI